MDISPNIIATAFTPDEAGFEVSVSDAEVVVESVLDVIVSDGEEVDVSSDFVASEILVEMMVSMVKLSEITSIFVPSVSLATTLIK